jgi:NAD(P)-dependent dehydrogenase (short-subunit alcohol dehydrogenase family)
MLCGAKPNPQNAVCPGRIDTNIFENMEVREVDREKVRVEFTPGRSECNVAMLFQLIAQGVSFTVLSILWLPYLSASMKISGVFMFLDALCGKQILRGCSLPRPMVPVRTGKIPLTRGKAGSSWDVAQLVTFLCSHGARHITGSQACMRGGT